MPKLTRQGFDDMLQTLAVAMVDASDGHLRLAKNEENETKDFVADADEFLKLDEQRLGRDLKLYGFMSDIMTIEGVLPDFVVEVVLPCKNVLPESYRLAAEKMIEVGRQQYGPQHIKAWEDIFDLSAAAPTP